MLHPVEGEIFYVDKTLTWTSFDVVKRVRGELSRHTKIKKLKVGHAGNPVVQFLHFAHLLFRRLLVVPEIGHVRAQFLFFDFYFLRVYVKDTSSTPTCVLLSLLIVLA